MGVCDMLYLVHENKTDLKVSLHFFSMVGIETGVQTIILFIGKIFQVFINGSYMETRATCESMLS